MLKEIEDTLQNAKVAELRPDCRYVFVLNNERISAEAVPIFIRVMKANGFQNIVVLHGSKDCLKVYEIEKEARET